MSAGPKRTKLIVAVIIAAIATTIAVAINRLEQHARGRDMPKIIASFDQAILMYVNESDRLERQLVKGDKGDASEWRQLDDQERRWLIEEVVRQMDAGPTWEKLVIADAWGHALRVEVRRPASRVEFRITSAGPDGRFGTDDDYDSVDKRRYRGSRTGP